MDKKWKQLACELDTAFKTLQPSTLERETLNLKPESQTNRSLHIVTPSYPLLRDLNPKLSTLNPVFLKVFLLEAGEKRGEAVMLLAAGEINYNKRGICQIAALRFRVCRGKSGPYGMYRV